MAVPPPSKTNARADLSRAQRVDGAINDLVSKPTARDSDFRDRDSIRRIETSTAVEAVTQTTSAGLDDTVNGGTSLG